MFPNKPHFGLVPIFVNFATEFTESTEKSSFSSVLSVAKFLRKRMVAQFKDIDHISLSALLLLTTSVHLNSSPHF